MKNSKTLSLEGKTEMNTKEGKLYTPKKLVFQPQYFSVLVCTDTSQNNLKSGEVLSEFFIHYLS